MKSTLPADHAVRLARALLALDGLSLGDAFGERYFCSPAVAASMIAQRGLAPAPWRYTDDTEMALAVTDVLAAYGAIRQDALSAAFGRRYQRDPTRGYGGGAHTILKLLSLGEPWREAAAVPFGVEGSMGNGAAMRAAPVGAYFADDMGAVVAQARASAEVTHLHPDGIAGAVAVAAATAYAWRRRNAPATVAGTALLPFVLEHTALGATRDGVRRAAEVPFTTPVTEVAALLGSGSKVLASDTVPFALWCAARHLDNFEDAMWATVAGLGDRDTTCAIAGGVVAVSVGRAGLPAAWLAAREALTLEALRAE